MYLVGKGVVVLLSSKSSDNLHDEIHLSLCMLVYPVWLWSGIVVHHDGPFTLWKRIPSWKTLPQLLSDEWHDWVQETEVGVKAYIQNVLSLLSLLLVSSKDWLDHFEEYTTKFFVEEVVQRISELHEVVLFHIFNGALGACIESRENPLVEVREVCWIRQLSMDWFVVLQSEELYRKLEGIPHLVAKCTSLECLVSIHGNVIHVGTGIVEESESESVSSTLRDALRELLLVRLDGLFDLLIREISSANSISKLLQSSSLDAINWVDNVSKGFGHFSVHLVSHHRVQNDSMERKLSRQLE
mmetsp:Transcript_6419/g.24102  ORF Transcript_6419/g.24102 Transcript_6419/m.24102 type:complete len:299 (+) Transcript_6419:474-1370(+)